MSFSWEQGVFYLAVLTYFQPSLRSFPSSPSLSHGLRSSKVAKEGVGLRLWRLLPFSSPSLHLPLALVDVCLTGCFSHLYSLQRSFGWLAKKKML